MNYNFFDYLLKNKLIKNRLSGLRKDDIEDFFLSHSSPDSIKAIKDFFLSAGVKSTGYKLPQEKINDISLPFISQLKNPDEFVVVDNFNNSEFIITSSEETRKKYSAESFYSRWSGVVLALDLKTKLLPSTRWTEKPLLKAKIDIIIITLLSLIFLFPFYRALTNYDISSLTVLGLTFIGLYSSFILMRLEYGKGGRFEKKICNANSKFNCKEVINSKISNLWGFISLAMLGFFLFSVLYFLILSYFVLAKDINTIISFICCLLSPFSLFLILYQIFKVKKICPFCTLAQLSILICSIVFLLKPDKPLQLISYQFIVSCIVSILFTLCIVLVLTIYYSYESLNNEVLSFRSLKHNSNVIKGLLENGRELISDGKNTIFKSRDGMTNVILAINLNCRHCYRAFLEYRHILDTMPRVGLGITFIVYSDNVKEIGGFIQRIEEVYKNNDPLWLDLLDKWFLDSEFRRLNSNKYYNETRLDNYLKWSSINAINTSPTFILDGGIWPREFSITDLSDYLRSKI